MSDAISVKPKKRGRPKRTGGLDPIVAFRIPPEKVARIDAALVDGETRSDFLVQAADRELKRRERKKGGQG